MPKEKKAKKVVEKQMVEIEAPEYKVMTVDLLGTNPLVTNRPPVGGISRKKKEAGVDKPLPTMDEQFEAHKHYLSDKRSLGIPAVALHNALQQACTTLNAAASKAGVRRNVTVFPHDMPTGLLKIDDGKCRQWTRDIPQKGGFGTSLPTSSPQFWPWTIKNVRIQFSGYSDKGMATIVEAAG